MALLNVKGTQKAAQIMKELEDHQLVLNKRVGLTKCNEIYLYPIDGQTLKKEPQKTMSKQTKFLEAPKFSPN